MTKSKQSNYKGSMLDSGLIAVSALIGLVITLLVETPVIG